MQDIYDKAEELADLIAHSEAYERLREKERLVDDCADVKKLVDEFNKQTAKIAEKERNQQPIEVHEKHELQRLQKELQSNEVLQELLRAQTDYAMLMNKVNSILRERLEGKQ